MPSAPTRPPRAVAWDTGPPARTAPAGRLPLADAHHRKREVHRWVISCCVRLSRWRTKARLQPRLCCRPVTRRCIPLPLRRSWQPYRRTRILDQRRDRVRGGASGNGVICRAQPQSLQTSTTRSQPPPPAVSKRSRATVAPRRHARLRAPPQATPPALPGPPTMNPRTPSLPHRKPQPLPRTALPARATSRATSAPPVQTAPLARVPPRLRTTRSQRRSDPHAPPAHRGRTQPAPHPESSRAQAARSPQESHPARHAGHGRREAQAERPASEATHGMWLLIFSPASCAHHHHQGYALPRR